MSKQRLDQLEQWGLNRVKQLEDDKKKKIGWWATEQKDKAESALNEARIWLEQIMNA